MNFYKLFLAASITIVSQQSIAGTLCAEKEGPVFQKIPPKGEIIPESNYKLISNITYKVLQEKPGWVLIEFGKSKLWSERTNFGTAKCSYGGKADPVKSTRHHAEKPKHTQPSSSGCPCGSGLVCHGPRGGRYCITSGGSKRYGV